MTKRFYCISTAHFSPYSKHIILADDFKNNVLFKGTYDDCKVHVFSEITSYFKGEIHPSIQKCHEINNCDYTFANPQMCNISNYSPDTIDDISTFAIDIHTSQDETNENIIIKVTRCCDDNNDSNTKCNAKSHGILLCYGTDGGLCIELSFILVQSDDIDYLSNSKTKEQKYYLVPIEPDEFNFEQSSEYTYPLKLFNINKHPASKDKKFVIGTLKECEKYFFSDLIEYFECIVPKNMEMIGICNNLIDMKGSNNEKCFLNFSPESTKSIKCNNVKCNLLIRGKNLIIKNCKHIDTPKKNSVKILGYGTSGGLCTSLHYFAIPVNHSSILKLSAHE